jgi:DNA-binding CsgD family transcriptional regulator
VLDSVAVSSPQVLDDLLHHLRLFISQDDRLDPQWLADWLQRQIGVDIALVDGAGRVEWSTAGLTGETLATLRPTLTQVSGGQLAAAVTQAGALEVRCEALGRQAPRPVLVVAGPSPLTREVTALASHTGTAIDAVRRVRHAEDLARRYRQTAGRLRVAITMALMAGDPLLARRMTAGAVPQLLDAEYLRVHLLRCPPPDRARLADTYQDPSGYHGDGLMMLCPVYRDHLICLIPADESGGADEGLGAILRSLVRDNPGYALGISDPQPLHATAEAYDQARHALAVAGHTLERVVAYDGHAPLARLLPRQQALVWARAVLQPISSAPRLTLDVTRLALTVPRSGVARLLGISRNTVTAHLRRVEDALGANLQNARSRAELALALTVAGLPPPGDNGAAELPAPLSLDSLLSTEPALTWARAFLKPLHEVGHNSVHETLRAWVEADTDAQQAARSLGISRTTVRAHLRTAEQLLNRSLLTPGPGIHDLVHALRVTDRAP